MTLRKNILNKRDLFKILLVIPFGIISFYMGFFGVTTFLEKYTAIIITLSIGFATFAITFSFLQYQFSPYKTLLRSISLKHLIFSCLVLLIATTPLFCLFLSLENVPTVGAFCIPILFYCLILLIVIASEETNPSIFLERKMSDRAIGRFLLKYDVRVNSELKHKESLDFSKPGEAPMHDFSNRYTTSSIPNDPFNHLLIVNEIALKNGDLLMYEYVIDHFLMLSDACLHSNTKEESRDFKFKVQKLITDSFETCVNSILKLSESLPVQNLLVYKVGDYIKSKALDNLQVREPSIGMSSTLTNFAKNMINKNDDASLYIISTFRQLAQKGIYDPPTGEDLNLFKNYLAIFPDLIKKIGQEAINKKASDFLFRCLEELGYLGCTAIKNNHYPVGIECLQAIVQLGREARNANIKCFWTRCALDAIDHAEERLTWMLTWVPSLEEKERNDWAESFSTAYSRLSGYKTEIFFVDKDSKIGYGIEKTSAPHIEGFMTEGYHKQINFSDFAEIKESKLY